MEATQTTTREEAIREDLAVKMIGRLRAERTDLQAQCESLRRERERILEAAGASDTAELLRALDRTKEVELENRALRQERGEVARRLGRLAEKVDQLDRDS
jgi:hypothetical protein